MQKNYCFKLELLNDGGNAHTAAYAEGSKTLLASFKLVEQGNKDTAAGSAYGVTEGDSAALGVNLGSVFLLKFELVFLILKHNELSSWQKLARNSTAHFHLLQT